MKAYVSSVIFSIARFSASAHCRRWCCHTCRSSKLGSLNVCITGSGRTPRPTPAGKQQRTHCLLKSGKSGRDQVADHARANMQLPFRSLPPAPPLTPHAAPATQSTSRHIKHASCTAAHPSAPLTRQLARYKFRMEKRRSSCTWPECCSCAARRSAGGSCAVVMLCMSCCRPRSSCRAATHSGSSTPTTTVSQLCTARHWEAGPLPAWAMNAPADIEMGRLQQEWVAAGKRLDRMSRCLRGVVQTWQLACSVTGGAARPAARLHCLLLGLQRPARLP